MASAATPPTCTHTLSKSQRGTSKRNGERERKRAEVREPNMTDREHAADREHVELSVVEVGVFLKEEDAIDGRARDPEGLRAS